MPVIVPDAEPTVAMPVLLLAQVPPPVLLVSVLVAPIHILVVPDMVAGAGLTVATTVDEQPVDNT
jgi:hypothetical protein